MYKKDTKFLVDNCLHIRPAVKLVNLSRKFESEIYIIKIKEKANAKNLFQIQKLGVIYGDTLTIEANGNDELLAVNELIKLVSCIK